MKTIIEEIVDLDPKRNDNAFSVMLNESQDNVDDFLRSVFGFLKRKTTYMNREGADKAISKVAREFQPKSQGVKSGFLGGSKAPKATAPAPKKDTPKAHEPAAAAVQPETAAPVGAPPSESAPKQDAAMPDDKFSDKADEDEGTGLPPNGGNGLDLEGYSWVQTLADVNINVPVPAGTRGRDCDVKITGKSLRAGVKSAQTMALDGTLHAAIVEDECFWNCDGKSIEITLQKKNTMSWWTTVVEGEPEVNIKKVQPENSKLGDLDGDTRQTVEKMMFDQRQKALNKPTSDEMNKQDMLKNFMDAHPEMDFSNAKIM